jgi:Mg2+ and Co2+ transporter CorA
MSAFIGEIDSARRDIASLLPLLNHKADVLSAFKKHRGMASHKKLSETDRISSQNVGVELYISDIQDHLATDLSSLRQFESLLARAQESYLAQLSISNVSGRQRTHVFLKRMGIITMVLTLINLLFGLFSTNVNGKVPMYTENNLTRFWVILGVSALVAAIILAWARKYRLF